MCNQNKRIPRIGDVYMVQFDGIESEQSGLRPALVFQNNVGNVHSPNVIVLPLTSRVKKSNQPTHVIVPSDRTELRRDSMVLCENPACISKNRLGAYITTLPDDIMSNVAVAHLLATSGISFLNPRLVLEIHKQASKLNAYTATG